MVSYQAPTSALPKAGFSASVAVLTTIRSMISPGICDELNSSVAPGKFATSDSSGFQVTTFWTSSVPENTETMSASEVLTTVTSFSARPGLLQGAGQQVMRDAELDQVDALARKLGHRLRRLADDAVIAVGEVADDQGRAVDAAHGRDGQRVHVGHDAAVEAARRVLVDRFDVVVDLHDLDLDAVFVGPLLDDALVRGPAPGHPADIDRPGDLEAVLGLDLARAEHEARREGERAEKPPSWSHADLPLLARADPNGRMEPRRGPRCRHRPRESPGLLSRRGSAGQPAGVRLSDLTPYPRGRNPRRIMRCLGKKDASARGRRVGRGQLPGCAPAGTVAALLGRARPRPRTASRSGIGRLNEVVSRSHRSLKVPPCDCDWPPSWP